MEFTSTRNRPVSRPFSRRVCLIWLASSHTHSHLGFFLSCMAAGLASRQLLIRALPPFHHQHPPCLLYVYIYYRGSTATMVAPLLPWQSPPLGYCSFSAWLLRHCPSAAWSLHQLSFHGSPCLLQHSLFCCPPPQPQVKLPPNCPLPSCYGSPCLAAITAFFCRSVAE